MVAKKILFVFIIFIVNVLYVNAENKMEYDKYLESQMFVETENGFVSTKELAIKLAEIYLIDLYGERIKKRFPLEATLKDEIWYVSGTLPAGYEGGIPIIKISKKTGAILGFINSK